MQFQADASRAVKRPYAEREKPRGAFGDLFPQAIPSAPETRAVKEKR